MYILYLRLYTYSRAKVKSQTSLCIIFHEKRYSWKWTINAHQVINCVRELNIFSIRLVNFSACNEQYFVMNNTLFVIFVCFWFMFPRYVIILCWTKSWLEQGLNQPPCTQNPTQLRSSVSQWAPLNQNKLRSRSKISHFMLAQPRFRTSRSACLCQWCTCHLE